MATTTRTLLAGLAATAALAIGGCAGSATANHALPEGPWLLVSAGDAEGALPVEAGEVTLVIDDDSVGGEVCNAYGGDLAGTVGTTTADSIDISEIVSTQMWCDAEGLMDLESRYLAALEAADEAQLVDGTLYLNGDDVRLRFRQG